MAVRQWKWKANGEVLESLWNISSWIIGVVSQQVFRLRAREDEGWLRIDLYLHRCNRMIRRRRFVQFNEYNYSCKYTQLIVTTLKNIMSSSSASVV